MGAIPLSLAGRGILNYLTRRPYCVSFELTHNCNARCRHCHRGAVVAETLATPARLLELGRRLRPVVAIMSGGEPLLRRDLLEIVRTLKRGCAPLRVFVNTNAALLDRALFDRLREAGVDEFLVSLDYPDRRHDEFRRIPGLFAHIEELVGELDAERRRCVVLTCVLQSHNFRHALALAELALEWGVNVNFSAYTPLRTDERELMIPNQALDEFRGEIARLIEFKRTHRNVLTSDWVLEGISRFFERGQIAGCRAGERSLVVNPDGTLSPCGLLVRHYSTLAELRREFTARNTCAACFTSTRGNSERPLKYLALDHVGYLRRRAEAAR